MSVTSGDEDSLLTAVATVGPIAVYMDASHTSFQVTHIVVYTLYPRPQATPRFYLAAVEKNQEKNLHSCEIKSGTSLGTRVYSLSLQI